MLQRPRAHAPPLTVASRLLDRLSRAGATKVFLIPGAHIDPLALALAESDQIQPVVCAHEGSAGFMAHGHALVSGGIGVCAGIGGPGASNFLSAAVCARIEGVPVLFLTGDVPPWSASLGAFQDGGSSGGRDQPLFLKALGCSRSLETRESLDEVLDATFLSLNRTPSAPAHLRVPCDLLAQEFYGSITKEGPFLPLKSTQYSRVPARISRSLRVAGPRVVLFIGEECSSPRVAGDLLAFAERFSIPVVTTLGAKGVIPEDHTLSLGNFGYGGSRRSTDALLGTPLDLLLVLGADLGERNTLGWDARLRALGGRLVAVGSSVQRNAYTQDFTRICAPGADAVRALGMLTEDAIAALTVNLPAREIWLESLRQLPTSYDEPLGWNDGPRLHPGRIVSEMRKILPRETIFFIDAGVHRLHAAHHWKAYSPNTFLSASRTAPMGWGLSAAIGGAFASGGAPVVAFTGDGCMRMHGMEIATAVRYGLPVLFVVCNNGALGNVYYRYRSAGPRAEAITRLPDVDWAAFANLMGMPARRVSTPQALEEALALAMESRGPFLIDALAQLEEGGAGPVGAANVNSLSPSSWRPLNWKRG